MKIRRRELLGGTALGFAGAALAQESAPPARPLEPAVTGPLCDFISGAAQASWHEEISELAKRHILDTLASIVACHELPAATVARRYAVAQSGPGSHPSPIFGGKDRATLRDAIFANAMAGHAAEINDFSPSAFVQPGPSIVSVALGVAHGRKLSGRAVLQSVVAGYEIGCRLPKALGNSNLRRYGLANHGIGPTFGCAATVSVLIGLSRERVGHVLSYCSQQASGSWQWLLDADHIEKAFVFAGMGARNGLDAALMVEAGFTGVPNNLDRAGGWLDNATFRGPGSDANRAYLIEKLGSRFELPLVGYKRFPSGGPTQAGLKGLLDLAGQVDRTQIEHVTIEMPGTDLEAFRVAAMPNLNLRYMAALILADGRVDFDAVQSKARMDGDQKVRALMERVELVHDPSQEKQPRVESARVTVTIAGGEKKTVFISEVPGFPTAPLNHAEVEEKALELMNPRLGATRARRVAESVWRIEKLDRVDPLFADLTAS